MLQKSEVLKNFIHVFLLIFLLNVSGCGIAQVLGLSRREASELMRKGDIDFILKAKLSSDFSRAVSELKELERVHPAAAFYMGLLAGGKTETGLIEEETSTLSAGDPEILLFCTALDSPSAPARREAARKLVSLILETKNMARPDIHPSENIPVEREIENIINYLDSINPKAKGEDHLLTVRSACLFRLGRYDEAIKLLSGGEKGGESDAEDQSDDWKPALNLLSTWKTSSGEHAESSAEHIRAFLFGNLPLDIRRWVFREVLSATGSSSKGTILKPFLSTEEIAALSHKISPLPYQVFINSINPALRDGGILFFSYPDLIADLGRAYQYTPAAREEGVKLFKTWLSFLEARENDPGIPPSLYENSTGDYREMEAFVKNLDSKALDELKFLCLFYSGRIERALAEYSSSTESFRQAKTFAPDALQSDACIWYMLMNTLASDPFTAVSLVISTMPQWNDVSYFSDILDSLSSYLTRNRHWNSLWEIFSSLERKNSGGVSRSGAPLAQYAWILGRAAQEGYFKTDRSAGSLFQIAFDEGKGSFYYRAMAASKLGKTFVPEGDVQGQKKERTKGQEDESEFILGFFECGAAALSLPYITEREGEMTVLELRKIAGALASSSRWKESLDLVSRYTSREDYELNRQDLLLFYPRPFLELMEKNAKETETGEEILYGLIRTESYFMTDVVSRSGAVGLAQLMPPTALEMAGRIARQGGPDYRSQDGVDLKNPGVNVHIGSYYLRYLTGQMGSPMLALLAYNGGMGRMRRWLATDREQKDGGLPHDIFLETIEFGETREYGRRVLAAAAVYGYLYYGMTMESVAADLFPAEIIR